MDKTLLVYASRHGSARAAAEMMAPILGPAAVIAPREFSAEKYGKFANAVLISSIYNEKILPEMSAFVAEQREWLSGRRTALICASLGGSDRCCAQFDLAAETDIVYRGALGGVLDPEKLTAEERERLEDFYRKIGGDFKYSDSSNDSDTVAAALAIRRLFEGEADMAPDELKAAAEEFIAAHNTGALAGDGIGGIRATPLEYNYRDGCFYFFSEGGEKFANFLLREDACLAIYDEYTTFSALRGLQVCGRIKLIAPESDEYRLTAQAKGLNYEKMLEMPARMYLLKLTPEKFIFLSSAFAAAGHKAKQTLYV